MHYDANKALLFTIIFLGMALFCLDLYLPLGIGNGVLYGGLVILSFLLPNRRGPLITASVCSVLTMADVGLSPTLDGVPLWMGVSNRLFSLTAIWLPALFFLHRRRTEEALRQAHAELDAKVKARTQEVNEVNEVLRAEINERKDRERSLRLSEAELQANQLKLSQSREDLRALAGQLLTAQEEERRRISRELHDDINQRLATLSMDLSQLEKSAGRHEDENVRSTIRSIAAGLTAVSDDVRNMAYRFHPSILDDLGLGKAIRRLVDDFTARSGVHVSYVHHDVCSVIPRDSSTCVYRVAQEMLTNIQRHAKASAVEVELMCEEDRITLSIRDDGCGFQVAAVSKNGERLGLLSMQERVRLARGQLKIVSAPGEGTHVEICIPVSQLVCND